MKFDEKSDFWRDIQGVVNRVVATHRPQVCELYTERSEDGEEYLVVELCYDDTSNKPFSPSLNTKLVYELREVLAGLGKPWFPHVYHNLPDTFTVEKLC